MKKDQSAQATKQDISMLMDEMGKLYDANERWKDEILDEVKGHFDITVENVRHDMRSANREEIEFLKDKSKDHEHRLKRVERAVGLAA